MTDEQKDAVIEAVVCHYEKTDATGYRHPMTATLIAGGALHIDNTGTFRRGPAPDLVGELLAAILGEHSLSRWDTSNDDHWEEIAELKVLASKLAAERARKAGK